MWWRLPRADLERQRGEANRQALKALVDAGQVLGLLAYMEGRPVGWCAVGPRESYPALARSRILRPVDDQAVWSVVCFFVDRHTRGQGITGPLLQAAIQYARERRASIVEGYPVEPQGRSADAFVYTGLASTFRKAGFIEVARRSETRPVMRYMISE
jgi:GNAT superfamily N-acetyltransferase